jgi:hypothetical protein
MAKKASRPFFVKYKNLTLLICGLIFAVFLVIIPVFQPLLLTFGSLGFVGAIVAGMLFVTTFTVATGAVLLGILLPQMGLIQLTILASIGAIIADLLIFFYVKDGLVGELTPIYKKLGGSKLNKILHSHTFSWTLPVLGAIIMASPIPDEIGVALLGLSRISVSKFLVISATLNLVGIFFFISFVLLARSVM